MKFIDPISWAIFLFFFFCFFDCVGSSLVFSGGTSGQEPTCQCRRHKRLGLDPWVRKIPWRRERQSSPVFLPGESHGQRSLAGYSLWGRKELDPTEAT